MASVAFVLPFGEPSEGFFPDTVLGLLCAEARAAGHRAHMLRVYYDGRSTDRDREITRRLSGWLADRDADVIVVDRLFDPTPVAEHVRAKSGRYAVLVTRGDSFDPVEGVDLVIGATTGSHPHGGTRRQPTPGELAVIFHGVLDAFDTGRPPGEVPGVALVDESGLRHGSPSSPAPLPRPFAPALDYDVICHGDPPPVVRKTLFGNRGCPFALDPGSNPHFFDVELPTDRPIARLGCAFCNMGGDYEKRPDGAVVGELVEQALYYSENAPRVSELVLDDQHSLRYLERLVGAAHTAGTRRYRWLFAARADAFVRETDRIRAAVRAAADTGHVLEVYLTGFEAFSDRELERYNKGTTARHMLAAVETMRSLAREHPGAFEYGAARGHSLVLWNPWTSPQDVHCSVETVRQHGLCELFDEIGRNRLRLYSDLPIYYAARRDGALIDEWDTNDEGAGRRKGYSVEQPWWFLDARTASAYRLATAMRDRLGTETEVAQLRAVLQWVEAHGPGSKERQREAESDVLTELERLDGELRTLAERGDGDGPPRGQQRRAVPAYFAGACNNGCEACPNRDVWMDDDVLAVHARVREARSRGAPVVLGGREPSLHPAFLELVRAASGDDRRPVGLVTNGRRFAYPRFARAAVRAGLTGASVKLFAPDPETADAISRDPGGHEQTKAGMRALRRAGLKGLELRIVLHGRNLGQAARWLELAAEVEADQLRIDLALDAVGVDGLEDAAATVKELATRCARERWPLEAAPLRAGMRMFEWLPLGSPG